MNKDTVEQKIIKYLAAGYGDKKPRLTTPQVVEYANEHGAEWRIYNSYCTKRTSYGGMPYSTGGGTRDYTGFSVSRKGSSLPFFDSTETYRTIGDLIRELPNHRELQEQAYAL